MSDMERRDRKMSTTCKKCGATHEIASAELGPVEMLRRLDAAHDMLSPHCPTRYTAEQSSS